MKSSSLIVRFSCGSYIAWGFFLTLRQVRTRRVPSEATSGTVLKRLGVEPGPAAAVQIYHNLCRTASSSSKRLSEEKLEKQ